MIGWRTLIPSFIGGIAIAVSAQLGVGIASAIVGNFINAIALVLARRQGLRGIE